MAGEAPYNHNAEWSVVTLADVTTKIGSGATPRGGSESYLPERATFAFVRSQNVFDRRFDASALAFITDEQANTLRGVMLQAGDVLLNITGDGITFGRAALVDKAALPACVNQHVSIVRADPTNAEPGFLLAYLSHPEVKQYLASFNSGGSRRAITKGHIESFRVPLPPLKIQQSIAVILGLLDDKIESNRLAINHAEALLDAVAEQAGALLPGAPLGAITSLARATANPMTLGDEPVDHFSLPAFDLGARPERSLASTIKSNKITVAGSSILVSRLNPRINRTWWAAPADGISALASTEFAVLTAETDLELAAVWLGVRDAFFRSELPRRVTGTSGSHQRVRPDDLLSIEIPDVRLLDEAVKATALGLLQLAHQRRDESAGLARLRDALLPELLSGRIRVGTTTEALEAVA